MKFVRTARGYQALTHEDETVSGTPREVSDELAKKLEKVGAEQGVTVLVFDSAEKAGEGLSTARRVGVATPDLSAGVGAVFGTGDAVQSPGVTPEGETPEQAGGTAPVTTNTPAVTAAQGTTGKDA